MTPEIRRLSKEVLLAETKRLLADVNTKTAELIQYLAEVDQRRLYLREGFSSMFAYCTRELGMSEGVAYARIRVARLARRLPAILPPLAAGEVHLRAITLLAPHITRKNVKELLALAAGKSRRQLEELLAERFPQRDARQMVRKLPTKTTSSEGRPRLMASQTSPPPQAAEMSGNRAAANGETSAANGTNADAGPNTAEALLTNSAAALAESTASRSDAVVTPLAPQRYKIVFTADQETHDALRELQDLMRHVVRDGSVAEISKRAYQLLLEKTRSIRYGAESRTRRAAKKAGRAKPKANAKANAKPNVEPNVEPKRSGVQRSRSDVPTERSNAPNTSGVSAHDNRRTSSPAKPVTRYIPVDVRHEVAERAQGQCEYVSRKGRRCEERAFLQFNHRIPFGRGGPNTADNIELLCAPHNQMQARADFGAVPLKKSA